MGGRQQKFPLKTIKCIFAGNLQCMKFSFTELYNLVKEIVLSPAAFWTSKKGVQESQSELLGGLLLPLISISSLAVFLGEFFGSAHFYMGFALLKALREAVLFFSFYFIAVYFVGNLMKTFGAEKNIGVARQLVAYSLAPFIVVSAATGLFRFLYILDIFGLYGFFIFWAGVRELVVFPDQKRDSYLIMIIVVNLIVFGLLAIVLSKIISAYF